MHKEMRDMEEKKKGLYETQEEMEKYILAAVEEDGGEIDAEQSLDELSDLLWTAGGEEAGRVIQKRESPHPKTYLGSGKIQEVKAMLEMCGASGVITDDELSPAQLRNLSEALGTKVIDRTLLILDIFSQRASTKEGQTQVELAQLNYRLTRLAGLGTELSRQGGSVGGGNHSRGAGETKLELDRRYIRQRIDVLKRQLKELESQREVARSRRVKNQIPVIALVGYTNAGKSTWFNRLTNSGVLEEDKLFATLETTTRKATLPSGREVLFSDTVGFIHKLPHHLVDAFRATLEEVRYADILLHVVDASDEKASMEMKVTMDAMEDLGAGDKPVLQLMNKQDQLQEMQRVVIFPQKGYQQLKVSAFREEDWHRVLSALDHILDEREVEYSVCIPYTEGRFVSLLRQNGKVLEEEYREEGTYLRVRKSKQYQNMVKAYLQS